MIHDDYFRLAETVDYTELPLTEQERWIAIGLLMLGEQSEREMLEKLAE